MSNNKLLVLRLSLVFFFISIYINGCTYKNENLANPLPDCSGFLPDTVSFSKNIVPLFTANCAISGCHSGSSPTGNLNLQSSSAYGQLNTAGTGYIDTINPTYSVLYSMLVSTSTPMPPSGSIGTCNIQLIQKWMKQGAKNN